MQVPKYDEPVRPELGRVSPAKVPGIVAADALGPDMGKVIEGATRDAANTTAVLAAHIEKRNEELSDEKAYATFVQASRDSQNLLLDPTTETATNEQGEEYQKPVGFLNRNGNLANNSIPEYDQKANQIYTKYVANLDNRTRAKFAKLFIPHNESLRNKVLEHETNQRDIAVKQGFLDFKDTMLEAIPLQDEATRLNSIKQVNQRINELEASGRMTYEQAQKQREDFSSSLVDQDLAKDNATTPENSYVLNELIKGKDGAYPDLSDKDRAASVERIQIKVNRNRKLNEFSIGLNQDQNEKQAYVDWLDKKLTPTQLKNLILSSGIRLKWGKTLMENFYKDAIDPKTDPFSYIKIKQMQNDGRPLEEVNQAILENSNSLSNQDKKSLINYNYKAEDKKDNMTLRFSAEALGGWANKMFDSMVGSDFSTSSEIVYDFLQRVEKAGAKGKAVDQILKDVQKDYIKKYNPPTSLLEDVPNIIASRNKIQKVYQATSKLKGTKPNAKPVSANSGMGYDDF